VRRCPAASLARRSRPRPDKEISSCRAPRRLSPHDQRPHSRGRKDLLSCFAWAVSIRSVNASAQAILLAHEPPMRHRIRSPRLQETVSSERPQHLSCLAS
jgi:hypothetical protein